MTGGVPSALDDVGRLVDGVVPKPFGGDDDRSKPAGDPPGTQSEVNVLIEPEPLSDCVPKPVQSVPCERVADRLIAPDTFGTDRFNVPNSGTLLPLPEDAGNEGTWLPPLGSVVALGATLFAKLEVEVESIEVDTRRVESGVSRFGTKADWIVLVCAIAPGLPAATKAAAASEVRSLWVFTGASLANSSLQPTQTPCRRSAVEAGEPLGWGP
jgi:hypothetical protein